MWFPICFASGVHYVCTLVLCTTWSSCRPAPECAFYCSAVDRFKRLIETSSVVRQAVVFFHWVSSEFPLDALVLPIRFPCDPHSIPLGLPLDPHWVSLWFPLKPPRFPSWFPWYSQLIPMGFPLGALVVPIGFPLGSHWISIGFPS